MVFSTDDFRCPHCGCKILKVVITGDDTSAWLKCTRCNTDGPYVPNDLTSILERYAHFMRTRSEIPPEGVNHE